MGIVLSAVIVAFLYLFLVYPLLIYPVHVASQPQNSLVELLLGGIVYVYVIIAAAEQVMTIAANLYGFKKYRLLTALYPEGSFFHQAQIKGERGFRGTAGAISGSYISFIFWYTLTYLYLGQHYQGMFDIKTVTVWNALYLSFTAISVGPAGLNPMSPVTQCLVMSEVAIGLFYTVLVFSVLAEWIKRRNEPTTPI